MFLLTGQGCSCEGAAKKGGNTEFALPSFRKRKGGGFFHPLLYYAQG